MGYSIKVFDLCKHYHGDGVVTKAIDQVNLTLNKGEFTSIVGPSGCGKSTLLNMIGTLDTPTSGRIFFDEDDPFALNSNELADFRFQRVGFVFQNFHLLPTLTALENVMVPFYARRTAFDKPERANQLILKVGLEGKLNHLPSQLSGGEQQRVAIARSLVNEPDWILADEPTGNLDTKNSEMIFHLIRSFQKEKGCGVVWVTHDRRLASLSDRIIEMRDGMIIHDSAAGVVSC